MTLACSWDICQQIRSAGVDFPAVITLGLRGNDGLLACSPAACQSIAMICLAGLWGPVSKYIAKVRWGFEASRASCFVEADYASWDSAWQIITFYRFCFLTDLRTICML